MRAKAGHVPAFSFVDYSVSCRVSAADKPTADVRANPLRSGALTPRQPLIRLPPPSPCRRGEGICRGPSPSPPTSRRARPLAPFTGRGLG
ncbi:hypothetical protein ELI30_02795 [Rhizobium leguminosarum]|nr:hypothetical protein ELI32_02795 [Rhizobium leguminosarum]TAV56822.1 hypothetical protein ELI31_02795 [Rhizobium leguminosarum]TAV67758.1 hypothetical protein ELI30_02795 [Rhizobium leguminosarum]